MNITVRRPFLDKLKDSGFKKVDEYLRFNDWNPKASVKLDVGMMTDDEKRKVVRVLRTDEVINRHSLWIIDLYDKARANPRNAIPKNLEHFATILKEYVATVPKYRVFRQGEDGDWDAYVAVSIGYTPPRKQRDGTIPAYTWMKLAYYHQGSVTTTNFNFSAQDVKGKTCSQILDEAGVITGSVDLDSQYERELAKYKSLRGAVGKQMWGSGTCSSTGGGWHRSSYSLDIDGRKAKLVIDDHEEGKNKDKNESTDGELPVLDGAFWKEKGLSRDDDDSDPVEAAEDSAVVLEVPLRPVVLVFNLEKHEQCWAHVNRLEDYVYDDTLADKLVLPSYQKELIETLVHRDRAEMQDIITGKAGGSVVLCSGEPGTGKTLTAEVFAETIKRPLYIVASSQLGTSPEELETELKLVLNRAARLGAIMLIDECDVYIRSRGEDLVQNAIVGIFLRVLEYFSGVLFMTTNRVTTVDDAILSRCTAQVRYETPTVEGQRKIWRTLSDLSSIKLSDKEIERFSKAHPKLVGRDVKGLLKLANMISVRSKKPITVESLEFVMKFKPTAESSK